MRTEYYTIQTDGQHEIEIKKSRFLCSLARVSDEDAAKAFIQVIKKDHWRANHNCSAFVVGERDEIQRSSDDGEPSGTAGSPMLEVLKKRELSNVVAVVTRYFGGTKLGAGGLIRAYSQSVSHALDAVGIVRGSLQQQVDCVIAYPLLGKLQNFLDNQPYALHEIQYAELVTVSCMVDEALVPLFIEAVTNLLNGQVTFTEGATMYFEQLIK